MKTLAAVPNRLNLTPSKKIRDDKFILRFTDLYNYLENTKRMIEFAMIPKRTTRVRRMPREMCTRRGTAPSSIKSCRCSGVQRDSSQSSHSKHVASSVSLLPPFGNHRTTSPMSRWRRKTRNIRWWSASRWHDSCLSSYCHFTLAAVRRECILPFTSCWWCLMIQERGLYRTGSSTETL